MGSIPGMKPMTVLVFALAAIGSLCPSTGFADCVFGCSSTVDFSSLTIDEEANVEWTVSGNCEGSHCMCDAEANNYRVGMPHYNPWYRYDHNCLPYSGSRGYACGYLGTLGSGRFLDFVASNHCWEPWPSGGCTSDPVTRQVWLDYHPSITQFHYSWLSNQVTIAAYYPHTSQDDTWHYQRHMYLTPLDINGNPTGARRSICSSELGITLRPTCTVSVGSVGVNTAFLKLEVEACGEAESQIIPYGILEPDDEPEMCGTNASAGAPVRLTNGNMRYQETLPLPSLVNGDRLLTFDTINRRRGFFGVGWWSVLDAVVEEEGGGYRVVTETNFMVLFDSNLNQIWPATGPTGSLVDLGVDGYIYTDAGGGVIRRFNGSGRLVSIEVLAQQASIVVAYDGDVPVSVGDSNGAWIRDIGTTEIQHGTEIWKLVDTIESRDPGTPTGTTWGFDYVNTNNGSNFYNEYRLETIAVGSAPWRTYEYDHRGNMLEARDGEGVPIESHTYHSGRGDDVGVAGFASSSRTATEHITDIEYRVDDPHGRAPNASQSEYVTRVTWASGRIAEYYIRPVRTSQGAHVAPHRVYEVNGDCGCPDGGDFQSFARDEFGRVERRQDARGYVTEWAYDDVTYPGLNRAIEIRRGYYPQGCDPVNDPIGCRLDPDALATTALVATDELSVVTSSYGDPSWPTRATSTCRTSVVDSDHDTCGDFQFDGETGSILSRARSGLVWNHTAGAGEPATRTTSTELYDGTEGPVFDPTLFHDGLQFQAAWMAEPQPENLPKAVDGPLVSPETPDETQLVYYPAAAGAQLSGRLAAKKVPAGDPIDHDDDLVTVYDGYDLFGNPTRIVDPRGVVNEIQYDALGRMEASTVKANCDSAFGFHQDPLCDQDLTSSYAYFGTTHRIWRLTQPGGAVTVNRCDDWGRVKDTFRGPSTTNLLELRRRFLADDTGAVTSEKLKRKEGTTWPAYHATEYGYNPSGLLETVTRPANWNDPNPGIESYEYDPAGNVVRFTDAAHTSPNVEYIYDPLGRLGTVRQLADADLARWIETAYEYDGHGNLAQVRDANGNVTTYSVDDFGQTFQIDSPVTGVTRMSFDPAGRMVWREDARGAVEVREYAVSGGPRQMTHSLPGPTADEVVAFTYDHGQRVGATSGSIVEGWTYDRRGSILSYQRGEQSLLFEYDENGSRSKRRRGECEVVSYSPDWAGRPSAVTYSPASCEEKLEILAIGIDWLPFGPVQHIQRDVDTAEVLDYDWQYRMTGQTATVGTSLPFVNRDYIFDPAGNLVRVDDLVDPARGRGFEYDDLGRLVYAEGPFGAFNAIDYQYDDIGTRLERFMRGDQQKRSEVFTMVGSTPVIDSVDVYGGNPASYDIGHDPAGNLTVDELATYDYSPRNKLSARTSMIEALTHTRTYEYDAAGLRARSATADAVPTEQHHYLLPDGRPFYETVSVGGAVDQAWTHVYVGGRLLGQVEHDFKGGEYVEYRLLHVVSDHIGFPIASLNREKMELWQGENRPFGEIAQFTGNKAQDPMLRYPGQWALRGDSPYLTELFHNGYRWYRPGWGRYTQADPAASILGFAYSNSNPMRYVDTAGLACSEWEPFYSGGESTFSHFGPSGDWFRLPPGYTIIGIGPISLLSLNVCCRAADWVHRSWEYENFKRECDCDDPISSEVSDYHTHPADPSPIDLLCGHCKRHEFKRWTRRRPDANWYWYGLECVLTFKECAALPD